MSDPTSRRLLINIFSTKPVRGERHGRTFRPAWIFTSGMRKLDFAMALGKDTGGDTSADTVIAEPMPEFIYSHQAINKKMPRRNLRGIFSPATYQHVPYLTITLAVCAPALTM